jgi:hypothetical protein
LTSTKFYNRQLNASACDKIRSGINCKILDQVNDIDLAKQLWGRIVVLQQGTNMIQKALYESPKIEATLFMIREGESLPDAYGRLGAFRVKVVAPSAARACSASSLSLVRVSSACASSLAWIKGMGLTRTPSMDGNTIQLSRATRMRRSGEDDWRTVRSEMDGVPGRNFRFVGLLDVEVGALAEDGAADLALAALERLFFDDVRVIARSRESPSDAPLARALFRSTSVGPALERGPRATGAPRAGISEFSSSSVGKPGAGRDGWQEPDEGREACY